MNKLNVGHIIKRTLLLISIPLLAAVIISANVYSGKKVCKQLSIDITNADKVNFVSNQDIQNALVEENDIEIGQTLVKDINTKQLEQLALSNKWIKNAEVYFSGTTLHIVVTQKEPIARVIQNEVSSMYYDNEGLEIALCAEHTANVPVFTTPSILGDTKGNKLKQDILSISRYIQKDTFWNAMIAQVDVNANNEFEIVPQIGGQIIHFGNAELIEDKFNRLLKFYQEVLPRVGWQRYNALSVKFKKQVVATLVDSLTDVKLLKHIDSLQKTAQANMVSTTTVATPAVAVVPKPIAPQPTKSAQPKPTTNQPKPSAVVAKTKATQPTAQTTYTVNKRPSINNVDKTKAVATMQAQVKKNNEAPKATNKTVDKKKENKQILPKPKTVKAQNIKDEYQ